MEGESSEEQTGNMCLGESYEEKIWRKKQNYHIHSHEIFLWNRHLKLLVQKIMVNELQVFVCWVEIVLKYLCIVLLVSIFVTRSLVEGTGEGGRWVAGQDVLPTAGGPL